MRIPVKISMDDTHAPVVEVAGQDITDGIVHIGFTIDRDRGPMLYLEMKVDPDIDVPAGVEFAASQSAQEFVDSLRVDNLKKAVDTGDFATHPAELVLNEVRRQVRAQ